MSESISNREAEITSKLNAGGARGYAAITSILEQKGASVPLISIVEPYTRDELVASINMAFYRFEEIIANKTDLLISDLDEQVYFFFSQIKASCSDYDELSPRKQNEAQYQWLKRWLTKLRDDWLTALFSGIEGAVQQGKQQAEVHRESRRILSDQFNEYKDGRFRIQELFQFIVEVKINEIYLANQPASEQIKALLQGRKKTVPIVYLGAPFNHAVDMVGKVNDAYFEYKRRLGRHDLSEQDVADSFFQAQAEAWSTTRADNSAADHPDETAYQWLKKLLGNLPDAAITNRFKSMTDMLETKGQQSPKMKWQAFYGLLNNYLPKSTKFNSFITKSIQGIIEKKIQAVHQAQPQPVVVPQPGVEPQPVVESQPGVKSQSVGESQPGVHGLSETEITEVYGIVVPLDPVPSLLWGKQAPPISFEAMVQRLEREFNAAHPENSGTQDGAAHAKVAFTFVTNRAQAYYRRKYDDPDKWTASELALKSKDYIIILWSQYEQGHTAMQAIKAGLPTAMRGKTLAQGESASHTLISEQLPSSLGARLRAGITDVILRGACPLFASAIDPEVQNKHADPLLSAVKYASDEHIWMLKGLAHGEILGKSLTPRECLILGVANSRALLESGSEADKALLMFGMALEFAKLNGTLNAAQLRALSDELKSKAEADKPISAQVLQQYLDRGTSLTSLEEEMARIWFTLSGLPTARGVLAQILLPYGYSTTDKITTTSLEYSYGGRFKSLLMVGMTTPLDEVKSPTETATFDEFMLTRASEFEEIQITPTPTSAHAKQHGMAPVTLKPADVRIELKKQLDVIKRALEGRSGPMLISQIKQELRKQGLKADYVRLTRIYQPIALLDNGPLPPDMQLDRAVRRAMPTVVQGTILFWAWEISSLSKEIAWSTARKIQHNSLIFEVIDNDRATTLCAVKFDVKTSAFQSINFLPIGGDWSTDDITAYVREHPIEFFHAVPTPEPGASVQYMTQEIAIEAPVPLLIGVAHVLALKELKRWLSPGRFKRDEKIPRYVAEMIGLMSKLGLYASEQVKPELKPAVDTLKGLHHRFSSTNLLYLGGMYQTDAMWTPILAMTEEERQQALAALAQLETLLNQSIAEQQAPYFLALDRHTGLHERIDRLVEDADRHFHTASLGEFLLGFVPFFDCVKELAEISRGDPVDTQVLLNGAEPTKNEGVSYGSAVMTTFGCAMDVAGLIPFVQAGAVALKAASLALQVTIKQVAQAAGRTGIKQMAKQVLLNSAMKTAFRSLGKAGVQLVVQGVDQVSPIPGTDWAINKMLKTMWRGSRGSVKAVKSLLQILDPALFNKLGDIPSVKPMSVLPDAVDVNTHFKLGVKDGWHIDWDNPPMTEIKSGREYIKDSEIVIATVGGQEVTVRKVGMNQAGQDYFKYVDPETGELKGGPMRLLPPIGSEASETAQIDIFEYRRMDGTVEATQSTVGWDRVSQVADGDESLLMVRGQDTYYVIETDGDTTRFRLALDEEVAAYGGCFGVPI